MNLRPFTLRCERVGGISRGAAGAIFALVCLAFVVIVPSSALANSGEFKPGEIEDFTQESSGKYAFTDKGKVVAEYSKTDGEALLRRIRAVELDSGSQSYARTDVPGETLADQKSAAEAYEHLTNNLEYKTDGEADVGDGLIADAESEGILPAVGDVVASAGTVGALGGAAFVGVQIGNGIDEIIGLPTLGEALGIEGSSALEEWGYFSFNNAFLPGKYALDEGAPCKAALPKWPEGPFDIAEDGYCIGVSDRDETERIRHEAGHPPKVQETLEVVVGPTFGPTNESGIGLTEGTFGIGVCRDIDWSCKPNAGSEGKLTLTYLEFKGHESRQANPCTLRTVCRAGYVQPAPAPSPVIAPTPKEMTPPEKKSAPIVPPTPEEVPVDVPWWIAHESEPEIDPEKGTLPGNPLWPEILPVESNEVYTHYKGRLEAEGFTDVKESVLPESLIDTRVGPEQISRVVPVEKTRAEPSTPVDVVVNPVDAPPVDGEPHVPVGPPNLPGIDKPDFGVVCKGFPFGVPCWIADTITAWSATAKAPVLGIEDWKISIMGHKQTLNAMFDLAKLEPIMSRVRPAMLIFATIGIVLLFFKFAKGGGPPSGSGGDTTDGGEDGGL